LLGISLTATPGKRMERYSVVMTDTIFEIDLGIVHEQPFSPHELEWTTLDRLEH